MAQATLDDDDLFGEAAGELREDVQAHIAAGWDSLPGEDAIWRAEADNVLGVLNTLRNAMDVGDAREHVRDAKKWFTMGERANAFDDAAGLEEELRRLEETIDRIETIQADVAHLASALPGVKEDLAAANGDQD